MESAIETSDLKWSGIWYKRPRIVVRSMSDRSTLQQISTSVGTSLEGDVVRILVETWVPRPIELCDVSSGRVIGKRVTDIQSLLVHDDAMSNFLLFFFSTLVLV